jgi:HNH endonuclease
MGLMLDTGTKSSEPCQHEPKYCKGKCKKCYFRDYGARWHKANRTRHAAANRAWALSHPNEARAFNRKSWAKHRNERLAEAKAWLKAHPDWNRAKSHRRRAREAGAFGGDYTPAQWNTLKRHLGFRCVGCWKTETELTALGRMLVPDHIVPIAKGGLNHITNIQPLCHGRGGCNNRKGGRYMDFVIS